MSFSGVPDLILEPMIRNALMEDLGSYGDVTTRAVIPAETTYTARLNARADAIVSGMQVSHIAFHLVDASLEVETHFIDGQPCKAGDTLMTI